MRKTPRNPTIVDSPSRSLRETETLGLIARIKKLDFLIPVKIVSEANQREHYMAKHRRKKEQQEIVLVALYNNLKGRKVSMPCVVKLTRIGPRALDSDNLAGSFKHVQDTIAWKLKVDDGDTANVTWQYHQMPIGVREYGVKVEIQSV